MSDILIRGGTIIDGTGGPSRQADLRIRDGLVAEIAPGLKPGGAKVIDASDALVTPGFIDCHTHLDAAMFWDPACDQMTQHGVTTVLVGNCSLGLAPIRHADRARVIDVFSYIEDIPSEAMSTALPWNWETFPEYAEEMRKRPLGVNVATLIPHSLLRMYVMGDAAWERAATADEIEAIALEYRKAAKAGGVGLSYSLFDKDRQGRPVPSYHADDRELDRMFREIGAHRGVFQVVCSMGDGIVTDLTRLAPFAAKHGVTILHNAIAYVSYQPEFSANLLEVLRGFQQNGAKVYSMMSPRSFDFELNFHSTIIFIDYPVWNEIIQAEPARKRELLKDPTWRARARHEFAEAAQRSAVSMFQFGQIHNVRINGIGPNQDPSWLDRSMKDLFDAKGGDPADVLADWVLESDLEARFIIPVSNTDPVGMSGVLRRPEVIVGGSDAGAHVQMFCASGDTTLFLKEYVRDRSVFSVEDGIYQLTGRLADMLNLRDRGRLQVGKPADIAVFALNELHWDKAFSVKDLPGGRARYTRPPGGFRLTMINGQIVQEAGKSTTALPAKFLSGMGAAA